MTTDKGEGMYKRDEVAELIAEDIQVITGHKEPSRNFLRLADRILASLGVSSARLYGRGCPPHGPWMQDAEYGKHQCQSCGMWFESRTPTDGEQETGGKDG